jgi:hypothetical protein
MHSYFVGQQVVCICDKWNIYVNNQRYRLLGGPKSSEVCIITSIRDDGYLSLVGYDSIKQWNTIEGTIINFTHPGPMCWDWRDFRPLSKKSTDTGMEILKKIALTGKLPARKKQKEAA